MQIYIFQIYILRNELFEDRNDRQLISSDSLQCVYWNRGHPDNENQSEGRIETIDSNIFKSSQMPSTKQWNLNLFVDRWCLRDYGVG